MKKNYLILVVLLFFAGMINAQSDFKPGYIVKVSGDTLFGHIDFRGELLNSRKCRFKNVDNNVVEYTPNDLISYRFIDSKYYVSRDLKNEKVFLEFLIKGKINIYYIGDEFGEHYYLDKEGEPLTEIPYEVGTKFEGDKQYAFESTKHIGILSYYMQDAPQLQSQIQAIEEPSQKNMIRLAENYHNAVCEGEKCIIFEKKLPLVKLSLTPCMAFVKYDGLDSFESEFGGLVNVWSPRSNDRISFKTGFLYSQISMVNKFNDQITTTLLKFPAQIQYSYNAHRLQPNISVGAMLYIAKYYVKADYGDYSEQGKYRNFALNVGLDYNIYKRFYLMTAINTEFTPLLSLIGGGDDDSSEGFNMYSYGFVFGLRIDL